MAAKDTGINTAMESMGCAKWESIEDVLPYLDTYLLDIKHMNAEKHRAYTGKSNVLMLENAKKIAASGMTELIIRVPVVPGFNDTVQEITDIAKFAESLKGVEQIHLLPYHRLGQDKYGQLGREYTLTEIRPPEPEHMRLLQDAVQKTTRLYCQIGG